MLHAGLLLDGLGDHGVDVGIALVGDDALSIVVHFLLAVLDVLVDVRDQVLIQLQLFHDLVVALEQLDGVPAQEAVIHLALNGLFDVGNGMLHTAGKHMGQLAGLFALGSGHGSLGSCLGALALQGADLDRLAAQLGAQLLQVDLVAVLAHQVDHVHSHDHRDAQLDQLGGQVQVALDVGAVHDVEDGVRLLIDQVVAGHHLLQPEGQPLPQCAVLPRQAPVGTGVPLQRGLGLLPGAVGAGIAPSVLPEHRVIQLPLRVVCKILLDRLSGHGCIPLSFSLVLRCRRIAKGPCAADHGAA